MQIYGEHPWEAQMAGEDVSGYATGHQGTYSGTHCGLQRAGARGRGRARGEAARASRGEAPGARTSARGARFQLAEWSWIEFMSDVSVTAAGFKARGTRGENRRSGLRP